MFLEVLRNTMTVLQRIILFLGMQKIKKTNGLVILFIKLKIVKAKNLSIIFFIILKLCTLFKTSERHKTLTFMTPFMYSNKAESQEV